MKTPVVGCIGAVISVLTVVASGARAQSLTLYNAALGGLPGSQGSLATGNVGTTPATETFFAATQNTPAFTRLDSSASLATYAGYSNRTATVGPSADPPFFTLTPGAFVNPAFPTLNRNTGFTLSFTIRQNSQTTINPARAGFSVILLGSDSQGVELGFQGDTIFSQAPGFASAAESVSGANISTLTSTFTAYTLNITGSTYTLAAANTTLLTGQVKDYTGATGFAGNIYRSTSFISLGDDTTAASGNTDFSFVGINAVTAAPEPSAGLLCIAGSGVSLLAFAAVRKRKQTH